MEITISADGHILIKASEHDPVALTFYDNNGRIIMGTLIERTQEMYIGGGYYKVKATSKAT